MGLQTGGGESTGGPNGTATYVEQAPVGLRIEFPPQEVEFGVTDATATRSCIPSVVLLWCHRPATLRHASIKPLAARVTSSAAVIMPTDNLTAPAARAESTPIAAKTPLTVSCSE